MPEKVSEDYSFPTTGHGFKYPYELLFDGRTWRCRPGVDFTTSRQAFPYRMRQEAEKRGLDLRTAREKDGRVVLRASKKS